MDERGVGIFIAAGHPQRVVDARGAITGCDWQRKPHHERHFGRRKTLSSQAAMTQSSSALGLLLQLHAQTAWRRLKSLREQSRLLTAVILGFISSYLVLAFGLFYKGLEFIARFPGLGTVLTERLLFLLFAFLFVLLLLSNLVIGYTNLFRNRETSFLLTLPIGRQTIFQWKFIESTLLASWAFLFLIAPLLAAYGLIRAVPWHFYAV